jgi:hypothetical protein
VAVEQDDRRALELLLRVVLIKPCIISVLRRWLWSKMTGGLLSCCCLWG